MSKSIVFASNKLTSSQTTNFHSSKLKEFADDNFEFDENGRNGRKHCGKEQFARYKQILLFHSVLKRLLQETGKNQGLIWKELSVGHMVRFVLDGEDNISGKKEMLVTSISSFLPQCFQKPLSLLVVKTQDVVVKG